MSLSKGGTVSVPCARTHSHPLTTTMIIVDPSDVDDAASTTRTLTPPAPKIPPHFVKLIALSIALSLVSLITCLLDLAVTWPIKAVPAILAFCLSFPYHTVAVLLAWLHAHQIASILSFAPASPRSIAHAGVLAALWTVAAVFNICRAVQAMRPIYTCYYGPMQDDSKPFCVEEMTSNVFGLGPVPPVLAAVTAVAEALVLLVVVAVCFLHWRKGRAHQSDATELAPGSSAGSQSKVASA
ncbi:hypothetical protein BJ912DRAFT_991889 [Pholiota molesta]|nr:hypothetical protein BJ912DRAFT_991889 [Pholiota molesta]